MSVGHAAGARGFAGAAAEAARQVRGDVGVVERDRSLDGGAHQHQSAARRVILVREGEVGGARLQAEAAMHATVEAGARVLQRRGALGRERARNRCGAHPMIPGLRMLAGSKADLMRALRDRTPAAIGTRTAGTGGASRSAVQMPASMAWARPNAATAARAADTYPAFPAMRTTRCACSPSPKLARSPSGTSAHASGGVLHCRNAPPASMARMASTSTTHVSSTAGRAR